MHRLPAVRDRLIISWRVIEYRIYFIIIFAAKHPRQWTKEEVGVWLRWCTEEFSIEAINPDKFDLNGMNEHTI